MKTPAKNSTADRQAKRIAAATKRGWKYVGPDPTGKLVGLPPYAHSPTDYEAVPTMRLLRSR